MRDKVDLTPKGFSQQPQQHTLGPIVDDAVCRKEPFLTTREVFVPQHSKTFIAQN